MFDWLFARDKVSYQRGRRAGYKEGYTAHESEALATAECPNPYCAKFRAEWRTAKKRGYNDTIKDLEERLRHGHFVEGPYGVPCRCQICDLVGEYLEN